MNNYYKTIQKLLRQLGADGSYAGFKYTVYGIIRTIQNPDLIIYVCKGLYADIAIKYNANINNVERNIRTIINTIWNSGNRELLNTIFGKELTSKPKNTSFIDAMSQYVIDFCNGDTDLN